MPVAIPVRPSRTHRRSFYRLAEAFRQRRHWAELLALCTILDSCSSAGQRQPAQRTTLIANAVVLDGTGSAGRRVSVRLEADRITEVGDLSASASDDVVDASGLMLAPGLIDTHSHAASDLAENRDALGLVSQGITTIVSGQDGGSYFPLDSFFKRLENQPAAVNVASYAGHGTIRSHVMGEDYRRAATQAELDSMKKLLARAMDAGAIGLSTGLEYDPGIYSEPSEVIALARVAAAHGGRYISHIRSEDRGFWKAVDELINIGREARIPVQISHIKLAMRSLWGQTDSLLRVLDAARASGVDVTADIYPYTYWQSTLTVLFPDRDFENRETAAFVLREISAPEGLLMSNFTPDTTYIGKTLADISAMRNTDAVSTLIDMIREAESMEKRTGRSAESVIGTSMAEEDVQRLMFWKFANICTDGQLAGRHPRGFGSFPRVLGRYVREQKLMSWEEGIRKMTSLPARNMGIRDRGIIAPGLRADLVLFDPQSVIDHATPQNPRAVSSGISVVWVNGVRVYADGRTSGAHPGRVLRRTTRP